MDAGCKDCPNRHVGCHVECKQYNEFRILCEKRRAEQLEQGELNWMTNVKRFRRWSRIATNTMKGRGGGRKL